MHLSRMRNAKPKFSLILHINIVLLALLISASSTPPFLASPDKLEEAIASTAAGENISLSNRINFTTPEVGILYPVNWNTVKGTFQSEDMNSIITFTSPPQNDTDNSLATLNIARYDLGLVNMTTEQAIERYANLQLFSLKATVPDFQLIQFNEITLADRPAYQIVYTGLHGTEETKTMKLWVIDQSTFGSTAYTITYSTKSESYPIHLTSVIDMINSFVMRERVARAPSEAFLVVEFLEHVPEPSRLKLREVVNLPVLNSILGGDLTKFNDFIKGSTNILPSNFARLPADPDVNIAIHYHLSPPYLNATNNSIYAILVLVFANNISNRILAEPIDYKIRINGTNFNFTEDGSTSTGLDIRILNGSSFEEALKNTQEYKLEVDVLNMNRILSSKQLSESPITLVSLNRIR